MGLAQRLLEMSVEYSKDWTAHGALLKERQAIQTLLADMQVLIESSRWLVYHAAWLADTGHLTKSMTAQVRLLTGEMLKKATDMATLVYGGPGPSEQIDIKRYVHAVVPMEALEHGLESARAVIASQLLAVSEGESVP